MGKNGIAAIGYLSQTLGFAALSGVVFSLQAMNIGVADAIIVLAEWARYGS